MLTISSKKLKSLTTVVLLLWLFLFSGSCTRNQSPIPSAKESANSSTDANKPAPAQESSLPDPCTLLTKAEAESILGSPVKDPESNNLGGNKICDYNTVKLYGGIAPYSIHIAITPETRQVWDAGRKLHANPNELHPVAGLGEEAYFVTDELDIFSNQRSINVTVLKDIDRPTHMKSVQEAEKAVAEKIFAKMK
jgi:hypothetical protein